MGHSPRLLCPWDSLGKNTGMGCHALLQGIFPIQELNPYLWCFLHYRQVLLYLIKYCYLKCTKKLVNSKERNQCLQGTTDLNGYVSKEDTQIANKHRERCSVSLAIREMEIKTSLRSLYSLGCLDRNSWQGCTGTGTLIHCLI